MAVGTTDVAVDGGDHLRSRRVAVAHGRHEQAPGQPPADAATGERRHYATWAIGAVLSLLLVRVFTVLAVQAGLHVDESQYWVWSQSLQWGYYSKPPAIAALMGWSDALFGRSVLGVRLLPMLCYPAACFFLYRLVRQIEADVSSSAVVQQSVRLARAPSIAVLVFIASPVAGLTGLVATTDGPLLLAWAAASHALWVARRSGLARDWLVLGVWMGVGVLSKYTMGAFALAAVGFCLTGAGRSRAMAGCALSMVVACIMIAPHLAWNMSQGWPTIRHTLDITVSAEPRSVVGGLTRYASGIVLLVGPLVAPWMAWVLVQWARWAALAREHELAERSALLFSGWLIVPMALIGAVQAAHAGVEINWVSPITLGSAVLAAVLSGRFAGSRATSWLRALAGVQAVLIVGVTLLGDIGQRLQHPVPRVLDVWARMRGWEAAFERLRPVAVAAIRDNQRRRPADPPTLLLGTERAVIAHGAWAWRDMVASADGRCARRAGEGEQWGSEWPTSAGGTPADCPTWYAWRVPGQPARHHFELLHGLDLTRAPSEILVVGLDSIPPPLQAALQRPPELLSSTDFHPSGGGARRLNLWRVKLDRPDHVTGWGPVAVDAPRAG